MFFGREFTTFYIRNIVFYRVDRDVMEIGVFLDKFRWKAGAYAQ